VQDKDRFLNRAADKSLKVLVSTVETYPKTLVIILPRLIEGNGVYNFDKVTKTKTIERLLTNVNEKNAQDVVSVLVAPALNVER
jgi:DNA polymerase phi